jgi:hypothetical protein
MVHFSLYAFVPFGVLLATACIAGGISAWIELAARAPRRKLPVHTAKILYFPAPRPAVAAMEPALKAG